MPTYRNIHDGCIVRIVRTDFFGSAYILDDGTRWGYTDFHRSFQPLIDKPTTEKSELEATSSSMGVTDAYQAFP